MYSFIATAMESKLTIALSILLIAVNLVELYYIIVLYGYDEIISHEGNNIEISLNLRNLTFVFFLISVLNLLFISISMMSKLFSSGTRKP